MAHSPHSVTRTGWHFSLAPPARLFSSTPAKEGATLSQLKNRDPTCQSWHRLVGQDQLFKLFWERMSGRAPHRKNTCLEPLGCNTEGVSEGGAVGPVLGRRPWGHA